MLDTKQFAWPTVTYKHLNSKHANSNGNLQISPQLGNNNGDDKLYEG